MVDRRMMVPTLVFSLDESINLKDLDCLPKRISANSELLSEFPLRR